LDPDDNAVVVWAEQVGTGHHLFSRRRNGQQWDFLGGDINATVGSTADVTSFSMALGASGNPVVAWGESGVVHVARWTGSTWYQGTHGTTLSAPSVAVDSGDHPVVAAVDSSGGLRVFRLNMPVSPPPGTPISTQVGDALAGATRASLAIHSDGRILVAYTTGMGAGVFVEECGTSWSPLGHDLAVDPSARVYRGPLLALDAAGHPAVAWTEEWSPASHQYVHLLHVKRYNGE